MFKMHHEGTVKDKLVIFLHNYEPHLKQKVYYKLSSPKVRARVDIFVVPNFDGLHRKMYFTSLLSFQKIHNGNIQVEIHKARIYFQLFQV